MTSQVVTPAAAWVGNERYRKSWYWYDWANSAYVTTTATVLLAPYLTAVAEQAACPGLAEGASAPRTSTCSASRSPRARSCFYTVTVATIVSAIVLIFVGAIADRSPRPTRLLGRLRLGRLARRDPDVLRRRHATGSSASC